MKVTASETTYNAYGAECSSETGWKRVFVSAGGIKVEYRDGQTYFHQTDHLGTPGVQTNSAANLVETWSYYPFGEQWEQTGAGGNEHRFTGHRRDPETGNDHAGARYLEAAAGRWLSVDQDPAGGAPPASSRYAYTGDDPVNYTDPDGRRGLRVSPFISICHYHDGNGESTSHCPIVPNPYYNPFPTGPVSAREEWQAERETGGFFRTIFPFTRNFQQRVNKALNELDEKIVPGELSTDCQRLFDAINVTPQQFLAKLHEVEDAGGFKDGTGIDTVFTAYSDVPNWETWSRAWLRDDQHFPESVFPSLTVAQLFEQRPGLNALSPPYIPVIFLRGRGAANAGTIAHEIIHKLTNLQHGDIQDLWGIDVTPGDSSNISTEFKKQCL